MTVQDLVALGDLNQLCSTRLFQNLNRAGISPWYVNRTADDGPRGGGIFARFDPISTAFRVLPNAPRFFQASLRTSLISNNEANLLSDRLLQLCLTLIPKYDGRFSHELRTGRIARIIQTARELRGCNLYEVHQNLFPDDLYASMPWVCLLEQHFRLNNFSPVAISTAVPADVAQNPLRALSVAVDLVNTGPSVGFSIEKILHVLDILENSPGCSQTEVPESGTENVKKIVLPSFADGLQGITIGIFNNLTPDKENFVTSQLLQFAATLEQDCAAFRRTQALRLINSGSSLLEAAQGFLMLMSPVQQLALAAGSEQIGFRLHLEEGYLAGYSQMNKASMEKMGDDPSTERLEVFVGGRSVRIFLQMLDSCEGFDAVFAFRRVRGCAKSLRALSGSSRAAILRIGELETVRASLQRDMAQENGPQTAVQGLYLIELALSHYRDGEALISNYGCRRFMADTLKRPVVGYQVCGKALQKYEQDIARLLPGKLTFEAVTSSTVKVRWSAEANCEERREEIAAE